MADPTFRITNNILNSIVKFEIEKKGIENKNLPEAIIQKARLGANSEDIFHLGNMLELNLSLKTAGKIASGKTLGIEDYKGLYLTNFRNAIEYILATQSAYYPIQANILLHLNKILITGIAEEWDSKFRSGGEQINEQDDNWLQFTDKDIPSVEVQSQALKIIEWFASKQNQVHPLITIPVVLFRLIRIAPFVFGNKITILATCKYLFFKGGIYIDGLIPLTKNFALFEKEYFEAWKEAISTNDDVTSWIEVFTRSFSGEAKTVGENVGKLLTEIRENNKQPFLELNKRQLKILRYLQNIPLVKREEYVEILDVSTMTAYRDLTQLVKKGLLRVEGHGRGTKYMLATR
ncbi:MAG: DeoR family transcriptional regulator [Patescibacteria group bacterium]|nr:DeoR family transcriptional regulator [Patescibacteria group bacterium]